MSGFVVSARKYRPGSFAAMVGQEHITRTLQHALRSGQLAHAFLFCGPRGVGKTTAARVLAKTINCENPTAAGEACNTCPSCESFNQNTSFNIYELDAASNNSVDDIRSLVDHVRFPPQSGRYKVYIIDEVHMLSAGAFNAFLKTLEEPPPYAKFILATTEKNKILPTILSRCQIFDFRRISLEKIMQQLREICSSEEIQADDDSLLLIAQKSDGGMRDALSLFDRLVNYGQGKLVFSEVLENLSELGYEYYFESANYLLSEDFPAWMAMFNQILSKGFEGEDYLMGFAAHLRNLLFCKDERTLLLLESGSQLKEKYREQAALLSADLILTCLQQINLAETQLKSSKNKRLTVEMALARMCFSGRLITQDSELSEVKKKITEPRQETPEQKVVVPVPVEETSRPVSPQSVVLRPPTPAPREQAPVVVPPPSTSDAIPAAVKPEVKSTEPARPAATPVASRTMRFRKAEDLAREQEGKTETEVSLNSDRAFDRDMSFLNAEMLAKAWQEFYKPYESNRIGLYHLCNMYEPEITLQGLRIVLHSATQKDSLQEIIPELRAFLDKKFGKWIDIALEVNEAEAKEMRPFRAKDKLEFLLKKNPSIEIMMKEMGLSLISDNKD